MFTHWVNIRKHDYGNAHIFWKGNTHEPLEVDTW